MMSIQDKRAESIQIWNLFSEEGKQRLIKTMSMEDDLFKDRPIESLTGREIELIITKLILKEKQYTQSQVDEMLDKQVCETTNYILKQRNM